MVLKYEHIAIIVTVISVSHIGIRVSADVCYLHSPLTATGRTHACPGEPLTFTCQVHGQFIQWTFNSGYRTILRKDQNVNTVQMVSERHGIRAILTSNDALPGNLLARSLRSALIIDSPLSGYSHNISCSSDTCISTQTNQLKIAEIPSVPPNVGVSLVQSSEQTFSLTWEEPENIERFDLEYFQISLFMSQPSITESDNQYSVNVTTTELGYHFIFPLPTVEYIMVTAISQCSHQHEFSVPAIWTNSKVTEPHQATTMNHSATVQDRTDHAPPKLINGFKREIPEKGFVGSLLACTVAVTMFLL